MADAPENRLWALLHEERAALAADLAELDQDQWHHETLCGDWDVEQVLAHLTAAASLNRWRWLRSMVGAGFRPGVHNQRRLDEYRGASSAETLQRFRAIIENKIAPTSDIPAYLGEVIVHAQDIRLPLGITRTPGIEATTPVAEFYARRDFAVASHTHIAGLELKANDGDFAAGAGPLVTGSTLALVMVMAGRVAYLDLLEGPGVPTLRAQIVK